MLPEDGVGSRRHFSMDNATKEGKMKSTEPDRAEDVRGECEYCDPNFMNVPGIEEALRGYDVPSGNPNPGYVLT